MPQKFAFFASRLRFAIDARRAVDTSLLTAASQVESFVKNPQSVNRPKGVNHEM
jgi:hypothetical protein